MTMRAIDEAFMEMPWYRELFPPDVSVARMEICNGTR